MQYVVVSELNEQAARELANSYDLEVGELVHTEPAECEEEYPTFVFVWVGGEWDCYYEGERLEDLFVGIGEGEAVVC